MAGRARTGCSCLPRLREVRSQDVLQGVHPRVASPVGVTGVLVPRLAHNVVSCHQAALCQEQQVAPGTPGCFVPCARRDHERLSAEYLPHRWLPQHNLRATEVVSDWCDGPQCYRVHLWYFCFLRSRRGSSWPAADGVYAGGQRAPSSRRRRSPCTYGRGATAVAGRRLGPRWMDMRRCLVWFHCAGDRATSSAGCL